MDVFTTKNERRERRLILSFIDIYWEVSIFQMSTYTRHLQIHHKEFVRDKKRQDKNHIDHVRLNAIHLFLLQMCQVTDR